MVYFFYGVVVNNFAIECAYLIDLSKSASNNMKNNANTASSLMTNINVY